MTALLTVGHGRLDRDGLLELLAAAGVELLVDVRRYPHSRANPQARREALAGWLPGNGIGYRWDQRLGGRRRVEPDAVDTWWRVAQFRAYAAWTRTPDFRDAMRELLDDAAVHRTVIMCAEAVWWRCHRRLIADVAVLLHGVEVMHLLPEGRRVDHKPASGARVCGRGVVWDGGR
jgi:uncharacterized protein (DUF488 family)